MGLARTKGQEVSINVVRGTVLEDTFQAILNFETTQKFERIVKSYLGQKSDTHDDIHNGVEGKFDMHLSSQRWFQFRQAAVQRAQRVQPDLQFNISITYFFPNGETPTVVYGDIKFGPMPEKVPARNDYVTVSVDFGCDSDDIQFS